MAGNVLNFKVCSPLKQRSGLTGKYYAICHYSYNLPLCPIKKTSRTNSTFGFCRHESQRRKNQKSCFLPTLDRT